MVVHRELELACLEPFVEDPKTRAIPKENLEPITVSIPKHEDMTAQWITSHGVANLRGQTIE